MTTYDFLLILMTTYDMTSMTTGDRTRPPTNAAGKSSRLESILALNAKRTKDKPASAGPKAPA